MKRTWSTALAAVNGRKIIIPLLFLLAFSLCAADGPSLDRRDLTIGGDQSASHIVVPDDKWMEQAAFDKLPDKDKTMTSWYPDQRNLTYFGAQLLREYFRKITGKELIVIRETEWEKQGKPAAVIVGPTRFAVRQFGSRLMPENLKRSGYVAKSVPGRLLICGVNAWGTYSGCAAVLEEQCGVEWFWPTDLGEEVPSKPELVFDRLDVTFQPAIAFSTGYMGEWGARAGERPLDMDFGHGLGPKIYHAGRLTNPEWFPLLDGKRFIPGPTGKDAVFSGSRAWPRPRRLNGPSRS
ncbi:MAG: hypothetical protein PHR35_05820 [Kiritimatiellae bacterium]|nr:hypothetical protein [Kiritimatiellia bacterium]